MTRFSFPLLAFTALTAGFLLTGCSGVEKEYKYPTGRDGQINEGDIYAERESIFGADGLGILGGKKKADEAGSGLTVNSFLWRASLDTVSFMPLASADPFGGVILTDWYQPDAEGKERFKLNVFILGRELRSDGISVKTFKQTLKGSTWVDAPVDETMARQLEDAILTRARQMRVSQLDD